MFFQLFVTTRERCWLHCSPGNGYITTQVLKEILRELDNRLTEEDIEGIVDEVDEDGSGTLDFDGRSITPFKTIHIEHHRGDFHISTNCARLKYWSGYEKMLHRNNLNGKFWSDQGNSGCNCRCRLISMPWHEISMFWQGVLNSRFSEWMNHLPVASFINKLLCVLCLFYTYLYIWIFNFEWLCEWFEHVWVWVSVHGMCLN